MKDRNKKRFIAVMMMILMAVLFIGCAKDISFDETSVEEATDETLTALRQTMEQNGDGVAVAYLGFDISDDDLETYLNDCGALEAFPFLKDFPVERLIRTEGAELYLVVPQNLDASVRVCDWVIDESNDFAGGAGEIEYYVADSGEPFLLECNMSDIMPNTVIYIAIDDEHVLEYNPALSLMDGSLNIPDVYESGFGVMDITTCQDSIL